MNKDMIEVVERIKEEYPNLYVDIEYHNNDDLYEIWHNDESLLEDENFHRFIGGLVYNLYKKDIFNFFIDYNLDKAAELVDMPIYESDKYESTMEHVEIENDEIHEDFSNETSERHKNKSYKPTEDEKCKFVFTLNPEIDNAENKNQELAKAA